MYIIILQTVLIIVLALLIVYGIFAIHGTLYTAFRKYAWSPKYLTLVSLGLLCIVLLFVSRIPYPLHFAMPVNMHAYTIDHIPASIPFSNAFHFLMSYRNFEQVEDIGFDPTDVPPPITRTTNEVVEFSLTAKEVIAEVTDGIYFNYWTYNGQTPGPLLRVREGDTVKLTLKNDPTSLHAHNIDLHAVEGPGGGSKLTRVSPGEEATFMFKASHPGVYVYHCASANVSVHNSHGQYGMIIVEPAEGFSKVDREIYLMQGELYTSGSLGTKGLAMFDPQALLDGEPTYVTFNGKIEDAPRIVLNTGERIRVYVGNGGVNLISSFHIIGEIFDTVYPEASIGGTVLHNVQTTAVLPGGAAIVEFTVDVPGEYIIVDHALARMNKGAWSIITAHGESRPDIFTPILSE